MINPNPSFVDLWIGGWKLEPSQVARHQILLSQFSLCHSDLDHPQVFYLPLADPGISVPSIRAEMQTIEADFAQLLFLRRVMQISLRGDWTAEAEQGPEGPSSVVMSASVSPNGVRTTTCCQQYHEDKEGATLASEKKTSFEVGVSKIFKNESLLIHRAWLVLDASRKRLWSRFPKSHWWQRGYIISVCFSVV